MPTGNQRYIRLAQQSPAGALMMLDVSVVAPELLLATRDDALADLRLGVRPKRFKVPSEAAAMDLTNGNVAQAARAVALGTAPASHGQGGLLAFCAGWAFACRRRCAGAAAAAPVWAFGGRGGGAGARQRGSDCFGLPPDARQASGRQPAARNLRCRSSWRRWPWVSRSPRVCASRLCRRRGFARAGVGPGLVFRADRLVGPQTLRSKQLPFGCFFGG
jgi:hypothetical protein